MTSSSSHNLSIAEHQTTIWESFLIDKEQLKRYAQSIDWEKESDVQGQAVSRLPLRSADVKIPAYYKQNFHGIKGGYIKFLVD